MSDAPEKPEPATADLLRDLAITEGYEATARLNFQDAKHQLNQAELRLASRLARERYGIRKGDIIEWSVSWSTHRRRIVVDIIRLERVDLWLRRHDPGVPPVFDVSYGGRNIKTDGTPGQQRFDCHQPDSASKIGRLEPA